MQKERTWMGMDIKSSRSVIVCFVLLSVLLSPSLKSAAQEKSDIKSEIIDKQVKIIYGSRSVLGFGP